MTKFFAVLAYLAFAASLSVSPPASARTPLKSPKQLAQDEFLFARASLQIQTAAMKCFSAPSAQQRRPVTVRFFLAGAGKQVSQLQVIEPRATPAPVRRAAYRAIKACAPYAVLDELRYWGGFWATVTFR
jgi:hypothetical protein